MLIFHTVSHLRSSLTQDCRWYWGHLLAIISVLAGVNPDGFTLNNPVATNPGYFMNPADNPFWYFIASQVDIFLLWTLALTAVGFATTGKTKTGTAYRDRYRVVDGYHSGIRSNLFVATGDGIAFVTISRGEAVRSNKSISLQSIRLPPLPLAVESAFQWQDPLSCAGGQKCR